MTDSEALRQLRRLGIVVDGQDIELVVRLHTEWLQSAARLRAAVEAQVEPSVGPATTFTHPLGR